ncbi:hypothetical protein Mal15_21980 [Stieleria maiorica]|uniref:Uncharacterized protein n=1 Tax=Stieleria maiorica TaxID=2795974 RepID=A0A5B9MDW8_9BACT|nr:hypothetical protein [Stieleria maiorica]QEF98150.1 hypothetical protein Mal15_21980 [Stieleria maiorica]
MTRNTSYAIELRAGDPLPASSTWIGGISNQSIRPGVQVNTEVTAGSENASYGEIGNIQPDATFTTMDIKTLLTAIGTKGECLIGVNDLGFKMWAIKRKPCGTIDTSGTPGVHTSWTIPNGLIIPQTLSVSHGSRASLSAQVFSLWDESNDSLIIAEDLAAPSPASPILDVNGYHLGPVNVAGISMTEKTSISMGFGMVVQPQSADGDVNAKSLFVAERKPFVQITCYDVSKFADIELVGKHATHANTAIVLRKKLLGSGAFMSGAEHAEFTADGVLSVQEIGADGHAPHAMQVTLSALDDGNNDMIVMDLSHTLS